MRVFSWEGLNGTLPFLSSGINFMKSTIAVVFAAALLSGCATITRSTVNQIQITSEPSGALVKTSLQQSCQTPCTLSVSRKDEFSVSFHHDGFVDETIFVKTQIASAGAAGFAGNVLAGGLIGMGVDAATGATLEQVPNPVHAVLRPAGPSNAARPAKGRAKAVARPATAPSTKEPASDEPLTD